MDSQNGFDDLNLVAQALDEARAQRTVDQARGENRLSTCAAFAAEERTGDAARSVRALFNINGEREEVELVFRGLADSGRGKDRRLVVQVGEGGPSGLLRETAGLEAHCALTEAAVVDDRLSGDDVGAFHHGGVSPCFGDMRLAPGFGLRSKSTASIRTTQCRGGP